MKKPSEVSLEVNYGQIGDGTKEVANVINTRTISMQNSKMFNSNDEVKNLTNNSVPKAEAITKMSFVTVSR